MKMSHKSAWLFLLSLAAMMQVSCGGSNGSTSVAGSPKVAIKWPALSRVVNAPHYARSVVITFSSDLSPMNGLRWTGDRPSGTNESVVIYPNSVQPQSGGGFLDVSFTGIQGGKGEVVASVELRVFVESDGTVLNSDGQPLGEISADFNNVKSIKIETTHIELEAQEKISISGTTPFSFGRVVALPTDSLKFSLLSGGGNVELGRTSLRGLKEGDFVLQASLEGTELTTTKTMSVVPKVRQSRYLNRKPSALVGGAQSEHLWGIFKEFDSTTPRELSSMDPLSGQLTTIKSPIDDINRLALSQDENSLWLGSIDDSKISRLDLSTLEMSDSLDLVVREGDTNYFGRCNEITVNPGNPKEIAIAPSFSSGLGSGPVIVRNGLLLPERPNDTCTSLLYTDSTNLVGVIGDFPGTIAKYAIGESGVALTSTHPNILEAYGEKLVAKGARLFTSLGTVVDKSNMTVVSKVRDGAVNEGKPILVAVDSFSDKVWYGFPLNFRTINNFGGIFSVADGVIVRCYRASDLSLLDSATYKFPAPAYVPASMIRYGAKGLAIRLTQGVFIIENAPGS
jgi:hypothetical protein